MSRVTSKQAGPDQLFWSSSKLCLAFLASLIWLLSGLVLEAVAAAGDLDDLGVVEEAVEDRRGRGAIAQELAPVLEGRLEVMMVARFS
jgi:hypothetical protein